MSISRSGSTNSSKLHNQRNEKCRFEEVRRTGMQPKVQFGELRTRNGRCCWPVAAIGKFPYAAIGSRPRDALGGREGSIQLFQLTLSD